MKQILSLILLTASAGFANAQNQLPMTINQEAPVVQTKEIFIDASPEKVWEVLVHIENWDDWNDRISKPVVNEKPEVGSTFTWKTNGSKIKSKIHTLQPNRILGWTGKTFGATAIHNWYLDSSGKGTTVKVEESMDGWIIGLMKKKMNRILADDMAYWLEKLKTESEK